MQPVKEGSEKAPNPLCCLWAASSPSIGRVTCREATESWKIPQRPTVSAPLNRWGHGGLGGEATGLGVRHHRVGGPGSQSGDREVRLL